MRRWFIVLVLATPLLGCPVLVDEFNDLLPLVTGASWQYDSDADDETWSIEAVAGDGHDEHPSFDYTLRASGGHKEPHDLFEGEEGWTEVAPSEETPDLYLKLPAEVGLIWEHEYIGTNYSYTEITYEDREAVNVPAGEYEDAWVLVRARESTYGTLETSKTYREWWVPGIGMVKRIETTSEGEDFTLTLTAVDLPEE